MKNLFRLSIRATLFVIVLYLRSNVDHSRNIRHVFFFIYSIQVLLDKDGFIRRILSDSKFDSKTNDYCSGVKFDDSDLPTGKAMDMIMDQRGDKPLRKTLDGDEDTTYYAKSLIPVLALCAVGLLFSIVAWYIYCCCNFECCCCKKGGKFKMPKVSGCKKVCVLVSFMIIGAGMIGLSITGMIYSA